MKKLFLITLLMAFAVEAQDSNLELLFRASDFVEDGGNLFASNNSGLRESGGVALKVSPAAPFTLDKTGAEIDVIHGGTFDSDLDLTGTATNQLKLPLSNDAVTPTIAFGDGNTGFYESVDNTLIIAVGGNGQWRITGSFLGSSNTSRAALLNTAPSSTIPVILPNADDQNTGIGLAAVDQLSLISGGVEGIRITEATTNSILLNGSVNFAADAQGDDDYEISLPGVTALVTGMTVTFTANTLNTDGATLEIGEVGDLDAILKLHDQALATGDIESGQVIVVVFDGTNWQMTSQLAQ